MQGAFDDWFRRVFPVPALTASQTLQAKCLRLSKGHSSKWLRNPKQRENKENCAKLLNAVSFPGVKPRYVQQVPRDYQRFFCRDQNTATVSVFFSWTLQKHRHFIDISTKAGLTVFLLKLGLLTNLKTLLLVQNQVVLPHLSLCKSKETLSAADLTCFESHEGHVLVRQVSDKGEELLCSSTAELLLRLKSFEGDLLILLEYKACKSKKRTLRRVIRTEVGAKEYLLTSLSETDVEIDDDRSKHSIIECTKSRKLVEVEALLQLLIKRFQLRIDNLVVDFLDDLPYRLHSFRLSSQTATTMVEGLPCVVRQKVTLPLPVRVEPTRSTKHCRASPDCANEGQVKVKRKYVFPGKQRRQSESVSVCRSCFCDIRKRLLKAREAQQQLKLQQKMQDDKITQVCCELYERHRRTEAEKKAARISALVEYDRLPAIAMSPMKALEDVKCHKFCRGDEVEFGKHRGKVINWFIEKGQVFYNVYTEEMLVFTQMRERDLTLVVEPEKPKLCYEAPALLKKKELKKYDRVMYTLELYRRGMSAMQPDEPPSAVRKGIRKGNRKQYLMRRALAKAETHSIDFGQSLKALWKFISDS